MNEDNIYNQLKQLLAKAGGKFNILEEQIDVDLQVDFFELINQLKKNNQNGLDFDDFSAVEKEIYDKNITIEQKRNILANLSTIEDPEAYRIIERFVEKRDKDLNQWAILALQHCRISLESHFLDEQQVFISTGLGGREEKLRYFIVCKLKDNVDISDSQKKIVKTEFEEIFKNHNSSIEKISYFDHYFSVLALIPINISINEVIKASIDESNNYGDFIHPRFLVTNVKVLQKNEIEKYFKNLGI